MRFFFICCLLSFLIVPEIQAQEETPEPTPEILATAESTNGELSFTFGELGYTNTNIKGAFGSGQMYLGIPASWQATQDAEVSLDITSSPLLTDISSLTVLVNNQPLTSATLNGATQTLDFTIPADLIHAPGLAFQFQGYLRVTDDECEDSNIASQWARVLGSSRVTFYITQSEELPQLSDLATLLFSRNLQSEKYPLLFIIPDEADQVALTTFIRVATGLAQIINDDGFQIDVTTVSEVTEEQLKISNVVLVGLPQEQPLLNELTLSTFKSDGSFYTEDNLPVPDTDGVLQIIHSPWNEDLHVLVASANDSEGLENIGKAFSDQATVHDLKGNYLFVSGPLPVDDRPLPPPWSTPETTFEQLGFGSRLIRGTGVLSEYYTLSRAPGAVFDRGGQFVLKGSASPLLRNEESYVAVFLNESPIGAYSLGNLIDNGALVFQIPTMIDEKFTQRLNLRIEVSNQITQEMCQTFDRENAWTQIDLSSSFVVSNVHLPLPNLQAFPYPFAAETTGSPTRIILPDSPTLYQLQGAVRLAFTLGFFSPANLDIEALHVRDFIADKYDGNLIFLVDANTQPDVNAFFPDLAEAIQPESTPEGTAEATVEIVPTVQPFQGRSIKLVDISLYRSLSKPFSLMFTEVNPVNKERVVMFIISETEEGFNAAVDALTLKVPPIEVYGTVAVAQPDSAPYLLFRPDNITELVESQNAQSEATPEVTPEAVQEEEVSFSPGNASFVIIVLPIAISLILIVVIWVLRRGRWGN